MKQILNIILASIMLVGAVPAIQANAEPAQPAQSTASTIMSYLATPMGLGLLAIGLIVANSDYWQKVNDRPTATRWDKLQRAQRGFIAGWYKYALDSTRWFRNGYRSFLGLDPIDQNNGNGNNPDEVDVNTYGQKEQEREDHEMAQKMREREDREYARRMQDQWNNEARPANNRRR